MGEGLRNLGETCFLNAAIQAVRPVLRHLLHRRADATMTMTTTTMVKELWRIVCGTEEDSDGVDPSGFVMEAERVLRRKLTSVADSSEFLMDVLAAVATECPLVADAFAVLQTPRSLLLRCDFCGVVDEDVGTVISFGLLIPPLPQQMRRREITPTEALELALNSSEEAEPGEVAAAVTTARRRGEYQRCKRCGTNGKECVQTEPRIVLGEAVVMVLADPTSTVLLPDEHCILRCGGDDDGRFGLVGLIGFRDGHYTALSRRRRGWRLLDDARDVAHSLEEYLSWSLITTAVFQREHPVVVVWHGKEDAASMPTMEVQIAGTFSGWKPQPCELIQDRDREWQWGARLWLVRGEHEIKFVVNGVWIVDAVLPTVRDPAGNLNNLLFVP